MFVKELLATLTRYLLLAYVILFYFFFSCTILDNFYVEKPIWMVDLGEKQQISGLVVVTWQGQGQGNVYKGIYF